MNHQQQIVVDNLNLIPYVIHRSQFTTDIPFEDAYQYGVEGLIKASKGWTSSKGKFSTYATIAIKRAIYRGRNEMVNMITLPNRVTENMGKYYKAVKELTITNKEVTLDNLRDYINLPDLEINIMMNIKERGTCVYPEEKLFNNIPSDFEIENNVDDKLNINIIKNKLNLLPKKLSEVLILHYGLDGTEPKTISEISKIVGIHRNYVSTRKSRAIQILRSLLKDEM